MNTYAAPTARPFTADERETIDAIRALPTEARTMAAASWDDMAADYRRAANGEGPHFDRLDRLDRELAAAKANVTAAMAAAVRP